MMECNCGGYYPVPTCPECMPKPTDHAEELAKLLEEARHSCLNVDNLLPRIDKALTNYREATK